MHRLWVRDPAAGLRREDRRKAHEVAKLLEELALALARFGRSSKVIVDAAAGKSYVGLLAAELLPPKEYGDFEVVTLEREVERVRSSREANLARSTGVRVECREGDVADAAVWPSAPTVVVALHACGGAADAILERSISAKARSLLLVPCCTGKSVRAMARAEHLAAELGVPRQAPVRRRVWQSLVVTERTLRLEVAGYRTEVVEFVAPTVTPHNLLFRAVLTHDEGRAAEAEARLSRLFPETSRG